MDAALKAVEAATGKEGAAPHLESLVEGMTAGKEKGEEADVTSPVSTEEADPPLREAGATTWGGEVMTFVATSQDYETAEDSGDVERAVPLRTAASSSPVIVRFNVFSHGAGPRVA